MGLVRLAPRRKGQVLGFQRIVDGSFNGDAVGVLCGWGGRPDSLTNCEHRVGRKEILLLTRDVSHAKEVDVFTAMEVRILALRVSPLV
jgi:hypothetical protein